MARESVNEVGGADGGRERVRAEGVEGLEEVTGLKGTALGLSLGAARVWRERARVAERALRRRAWRWGGMGFVGGVLADWFRLLIGG